MKALFRFESRVFCYTKKNLAVLLAFILALSFMVIYNNVRDRNYWPAMVKQLDHERALAASEEREVQDELKNTREANKITPNPYLDEQIEFLKEKLSFISEQRFFCLQQREIAKEYSKEKAWEMLELWIERDIHLLSGLEQGLIDANSRIFQEPLDIQERLAVNQALLHGQVFPLNSPYEMKATNFLYSLISYPWCLIPVIALALLSIDLFSGDFEGGAYKVLYSQAPRRSLIHGVKFVFRIGIGFFAVTGLIAAAFGLLSLFKGLGETSYPIFYAKCSYTIWATKAAVSLRPIISWQAFIGRGVPLYLALSLFIPVLTGTLSLLLATGVNTLSAVISLFFLDYSFRLLFNGSDIFNRVWPLAAMYIKDVLQGYYAGTALNYTVLLGAFSVLLLLLGLTALALRNLEGGRV